MAVVPRAAAEGFAAENVEVITHHNPWREPPADVLRIGISYAASFLKDLEDYGRTSSNRLKVVLVGLANAGKTSVAVRLERCAWSQPLPAAEERTVGVEIRDIMLGPSPAIDGRSGNPELDVKLWDFAGQRAYYDTHQVRDSLIQNVSPSAAAKWSLRTTVPHPVASGRCCHDYRWI